MIQSNINNQIKDVINTVNESTQDNMFNNLGTKNGIKFCEIIKIAEVNKMSVIVDASVWGYRGAEVTDSIDVSIVLVKPCCLSHALEELTDEFIELFLRNMANFHIVDNTFLKTYLLRILQIT